ncbi:MAG TPA: DUF535 family protein [Edaphobacter sp.]|jgi:uncharacterized protein VirK/YbjX|nr:DUF535 family protein [Edaphobacter sp.]
MRTWFLQLTRHGYYWFPPRLLRIVWALATHALSQRQVFAVLARSSLKRLPFIEPEFPFKYLSRDYLVRGLSVRQRASCFTHHYQRLHDSIPALLLSQVLHGELQLLEERDGQNQYCIAMGLARTEVREGEIFLHLKVNGEPVYVLQFTIVPGTIVGSTARDVLLISRLQGMKGCYTQVHAATKVFHEVAPPALLLAVLQGIAQALDIRELAGVCATSQFSYTPSCAATFTDAYDDFFTKIGAVRSDGLFYLSPIPVEDKPLQDIRNGHKARTRKKRAFKLEIADRAHDTLLGRN